MKDTGEFGRLAAKYPYILRFQRDTVSASARYTMRQMQMAEQDNAPADAIGYSDYGQGREWRTVADVRNEDLRRSWGLEPLVPERTILDVIERIKRETSIEPPAGDAYWKQELIAYIQRDPGEAAKFYWFMRKRLEDEAAAFERGG